jgi:uncharacterized protein
MRSMMSKPPYLSGGEGSTLVAVRLQPRAGRDKIVGVRGDVLAVKVGAAPVKGEANRALCKLLAKAAGVPPSRVSVVRGETARNKLVRLEGVAPAEARERLGPYR